MCRMILIYSSAPGQGHLSGGEDLLAVGGVDVPLQVGVLLVPAEAARRVRLELRAARARWPRVPDDGRRARGQLRRGARRRRAHAGGEAQHGARHHQKEHQKRRLARRHVGCVRWN
uniref:Uncharacterized protein n=1 Tax=Arundo donax TaxID=35708 RepID=A0A0A9G923_ARUDO